MTRKFKWIQIERCDFCWAIKMRNDFALLILFRELCSVLEYGLQIEFIYTKLENTLQRNRNSVGVFSFHWNSVKYMPRTPYSLPFSGLGTVLEERMYLIQLNSCIFSRYACLSDLTNLEVDFYSVLWSMLTIWWSKTQLSKYWKYCITDTFKIYSVIILKNCI